MPKQFNKDSLKVGDMVKIPDRHPDARNIEVIDLAEKGFAYSDSYRCLFEQYITYAEATQNGWTIILDEDEKENKYTDTGTQVQKLIHENNIKQAVIRNNKELIAKIEKYKQPGVADSFFRGIQRAIDIIQSKNDSLSKE